MIKTYERVDTSVKNMGKLGKVVENIYVATISLIMKETWNQQNDHISWYPKHPLQNVSFTFMTPNHYMKNRSFSPNI